MRDLSTFGKIYIAIEPVDFRKHAHGLSVTVEQAFGIKTHHDKTLFVFTNKRKNSVKLLYWDNTGLALWWKVLEKDRFRWPKSGQQSLMVKGKELRWLLDGIDFTRLKVHKKLDFS